MYCMFMYNIYMNSMKTLNMSSPLFPLQTSSSFLVTLMQVLDKTAPPGKEYWVNTGLENATTAAYCFFRPVSSIMFTSPTLYSTSLLATRHPGCIPTLSIGIWLTLSLWESVCGVEYWTDHCLMISKLSIRVQLKTRPQGKKVPKQLNITKLKDISTKQSFVEVLDEQFDTIPFRWARYGSSVDHCPGHCI